MKIYLIATAGYPNFGDEIVLRGWLKFITDRVHNTEIWIDCHSPGMLNHLFYNEFPNVHFTNFVWDIILSYAENNANESLEFGKLAWNEYKLIWERQSYMKSALLESDIVHIIGTGFLNNIWAKHYGILSFVAYAPYKKNQIKKIISGAGLMPLNLEILDNLTIVLNKFDKVDLRDKMSFETLLLSKNIQDKKLTMTGDDSFLLKLNPSKRSNSIIGLCIQGDFWNDAEVEFLIDSIVTYVNQLKINGEFSIRFYELIPGIDRKFYKNLQSKLDIEEYRDFKTNFEEGLDVSSHDIFISSRFHLHLLASRLGAVGFWLSAHESYYDIKHNSVQECGSNWQKFANNEMINIKLNKPDLKIMRDFENLKKDFAESLYPKKSIWRIFLSKISRSKVVL